MREIVTSVEIAAPAAVVWAILTDFSAYPEWNPFILRIEGRPEAGTTLRATIQPTGRAASQFAPRVLVADPARELRWRGTAPIPGLFRGEHRFVLHPDRKGTRLEHGESFAGLLVPFMGGVLRDTERGFVAMNEALRLRAERRATNLQNHKLEDNPPHGT